MLDGQLDWEFVANVNAMLSAGLRFDRIVSLPTRPPALQDSIRSSIYEVRPNGLEPDAVADRAAAFAALASHEVVRTRKGKEKVLDIRPLVDAIEVTGEGRLRFKILFGEAGSPKPSEVVGAILGPEGTVHAVEIERVGLFAELHGREVSPLIAGRAGGRS